MGENLIFILLGIVIVLLVAVIILLVSLKRNGNDAAIFDELRYNREEMSRGSRESREELVKALERVDSKIGAFKDENVKSRFELTEKITNSLDNIRENNYKQNERQTRIIAETVMRLQESNEKKLEEMRVTVDEKLTSTLTTRLNSSFKTVSEQLENVYKSLGEMKELSQGVTNNVTSLNRVLTNVKARGTWAEVQLESLLDQTIPSMYVKNYSPKENGQRVEFAVKIPSGENKNEITYLPIDSKFPLEDYIRLCNATESMDTNLIQAARKSLEDRVLAEAKEVKKYIEPPKTTPFAILYLATEGLYAEIISSKNGIIEKMQNENIMIAGPTTIMALLNSFSMGFKAIAINEKADEVRKLLSVAKSQYNVFGGVLEKAKKKIDETGKILDDAQKRNDLIQKKLKGIEMIEGNEADLLLGVSQADDIEFTED